MSQQLLKKSMKKGLYYSVMCNNIIHVTTQHRKEGSKMATKDQVFAVADELEASGQSLTLANVRKALGGGSYTTISEAMQEWRSRKSAQAAPIREPLPSVIAEKLDMLGGDLWAAALEMANARLAAESDALEAARQQIEAARQETVELADQLTSELDQAKSRIVELEAAEETGKGRVEGLRAEVVAANQRVAIAEARSEELRLELSRSHDLLRGRLIGQGVDPVASPASVPSPVPASSPDEAESVQAKPKRKR
jgi:chromosome segregation ATPase